jgi:hypothetical protein
VLRGGSHRFFFDVACRAFGGSLAGSGLTHLDHFTREEMPMWKRREVLGALALATAGVASAVKRTDAAQDRSEDEAKHKAMMKSCGDICGECTEACNKTFHHCLEQAAAGKLPHARTAQIAADCAAFCALSAELIARQSMLMAVSCRACADACRRCAADCERFDTDLVMKTCVDACKRCEESCRNMAKAMGAQG